jgi:hypothetical protein
MAKLVDYKEVWTEVKRSGSASIVVSKEAAKKITLGILQAKAKENVARKHAGLLYWSKFIIHRTPLNDTMIKITFTLCYESRL